MIDLKELARTVIENPHIEPEYKQFKTIGFDPDELLVLKEMSERELKALMLYCGIRVYDGVPLIVMEDDEMRMAYCVWRGDLIKSEKSKLKEKVKDGMRWAKRMERFMEAMDSQ